ncbi:MAG: 3-isopropylmalate dehydratase small subunit [Thermaerobacter sp.]|nr:3-isopropylmalate dehydratase small subunit [Thermaerobacter sp.]
MSPSGMTFSGKTWLLGDNISTDLLSPGHYVHDPMTVRLAHVLEAVRPEFAGGVQPGDVVVAGKNFGCGSSRESAPQHLKDLGVAAVVAESFARIFSRNAIAIGLPVLTCPFVAGRARDGEAITVSLDQGEVMLADGTRLQAERLPEAMLDVLARGGIVPMLREIGRR